MIMSVSNEQYQFLSNILYLKIELFFIYPCCHGQENKMSIQYQTELNVIQICCKAAPPIQRCSIREAKKAFHSYQSGLTNDQAKQVASWIESGCEGLQFQKAAHFTAMIVGLPHPERISANSQATPPAAPPAASSASATSATSAASAAGAASAANVTNQQQIKRDQTMYILSNDHTMVLATVKVASIGMMIGRETRKFRWSDYVIQKSGSALKDLKTALTPQAMALAKPFLNPGMILSDPLDYDMIVGLYRKTFGFDHVVNISIGQHVTELLAFIESDINWGIKSLASVLGNQNVDSVTDFAEKQMNFLETGQEFESENVVRFDPDEIFDTGCNVCGQTENLKKCSRCLKVQYCGTDCQGKDWSHHKYVCCP
jgi:hypothetical protein